jgi:hypothetical protein
LSDYIKTPEMANEVQDGINEGGASEKKAEVYEADILAAERRQFR